MGEEMEPEEWNDPLPEDDSEDGEETGGLFVYSLSCSAGKFTVGEQPLYTQHMPAAIRASAPARDYVVVGICLRNEFVESYDDTISADTSGLKTGECILVELIMMPLAVLQSNNEAAEEVPDTVMFQIFHPETINITPISGYAP